jgi:hypothetical protein
MNLLTAGAGKVGSLVLGDGAQYFARRILISAAPTGAEQDTGFDLPAKAVLIDVFVDVKVAEATGGTKTLDVGLLSSEGGGDFDGFVDGVSVATTGLKRAGATVTVGSNETYISATTRGVLLASFLAGANVDGDGGHYLEKPHMSSSVAAKSVSFKAGSNDFVEFRGSIWLLYVVFP